MNYQEFIESKKKTIVDSGFEPTELNENLFDFQRHIVTTALKKGKYAIFADCGLGKTLMQLSWADQVVKYTNQSVLILCPLAVSGQTINEGIKFGVNVEKWDNQEEVGVYITNYEQLENIDCSIFSGVVLDESSILKNFNGKQKGLIIDSFLNTPYKLACTATPSPNDPMELCNHAEFLNMMSRAEMLAMYFVHDGGETSKWRLKGHSIGDFYGFVSSWATMLSNPSDIGFNGDNYKLPELNMIEKMVRTPKQNNGLLFNETSVSATEFNQQLRLTKVERADQVAEIVNNSNENFIVWVNQNEEEELICKLIPEAVAVRGSDNPDKKEKLLLGFANNEFRVLVTKKKIAQFGLNYQNCRNQVFMSLDFSFEGLYQAIRRSYRFGQKQKVNIYLVTTDTMENVLVSIKNKQKQFIEMQEKMKNAVIKEHNQNNSRTGKTNINEHVSMFQGDCVEQLSNVKDESVGFSVFSPPFAELYTYSDSPNDMGNASDYTQFLKHFDFLCSELFRVLQSGRNIAVHCMDLPIQKGKEGFIGLRDFSGMLIDAFHNAGFIYHSRITIWKDPVVEMQRTKALGLLHKQVKKDSTMSRVGIPDYVLVFRKDGERNNPVTNTDIPVDLWQKIASPVWMDIDYSDTLQFREGRDERDEKHICPLQLPTIERLILLYSNKGDTVLTPFMGIGSEVYQAVKMGRKGIGIELKESYFDLAVKNVNKAVYEISQPTLF